MRSQRAHLSITFAQLWGLQVEVVEVSRVLSAARRLGDAAKLALTIHAEAVPPAEMMQGSTLAAALGDALRRTDAGVHVLSVEDMEQVPATAPIPKETTDSNIEWLFCGVAACLLVAAGGVITFLVRRRICRSAESSNKQVEQTSSVEDEKIGKGEEVKDVEATSEGSVSATASTKEPSETDAASNFDSGRALPGASAD